MKILVANLGSTSFKYRLFDMAGERQLARGGIERIGRRRAVASCRSATRARRRSASVPTMPRPSALPRATDRTPSRLPEAVSEVAAIAFKAVHGGGLSGVQRVNAEVLAAMEEMATSPRPTIRPTSRPCGCWREACRRFRWWRPSKPDFHHTIPDAQPHSTRFPTSGTEHDVRRWGFHGASHRYIAGRTAELLGRERSADHLLPPGRVQFAVRDPRRPAWRRAWA